MAIDWGSLTEAKIQRADDPAKDTCEDCGKYAEGCGGLCLECYDEHVAAMQEAFTPEDTQP